LSDALQRDQQRLSEDADGVDHDADIVAIQLLAREIRDMEIRAMLKTDPRTATCRFIAIGSSAIADPVKSESKGYGVACLEELWSTMIFLIAWHDRGFHHAQSV